jgi:hypothetical protein
MFSDTGNASSGSIELGFGLDLVGDFIYCSAPQTGRELDGGRRKQKNKITQSD